jgi:hypothetical protein
MADVNDMMAAYAKDAVEYAAKFKRKLDYSEESIAELEKLCTFLYAAIPKTFFKKLFRKMPSDETIIGVSKMLGGYLGEVVIKHYGGHWEVENFMNEGNTIVLVSGEIKAFPVGKIYKRLKNGPEDNILHFYGHIADELGKQV